MRELCRKQMWKYLEYLVNVHTLFHSTYGYWCCTVILYCTIACGRNTQQLLDCLTNAYIEDRLQLRKGYLYSYTITVPAQLFSMAYFASQNDLRFKVRNTQIKLENIV